MNMPRRLMLFIAEYRFAFGESLRPRTFLPAARSLLRYIIILLYAYIGHQHHSPST